MTELERFAWGTDASLYRLTPRKVVFPENEEEVADILHDAAASRSSVTFRAAGTSLSGQSVTDGTLLVAGKKWEKYSIGEGAGTITVQCGLVGGRVNALLSRFGRKIGPDPASIASAMMGGIIANNSSGMSCGVKANADRTLESVRIVLADGTVLDTADAASRDAFKLSHPDFLEKIRSLRDRVLADKELTERIRAKYSIKNVTGLNLLPLVSYSDPFDIIAHSIVGSEGTLAFLCSATLRTLPIAPLKADAMIYFDSIVQAARAVVAMKECDVTAAEMLDSRSLLSVGDKTADTAVLTQVTAASEDELNAKIEAVRTALDGFHTVTGVSFTRDAALSARYWAIRSGIFPTVGGMRREGTTCIIEDVAFPIHRLPEATADLSDMLTRHGYDDSCIYGHALDGNFHFIINQAFDNPAEIDRYEAMIRDVAEMVVEKYDGSLKAEHGTGRNMAPFVEYEWGKKAFGVMKELKAIFDPFGILNPGVIFNDDPKCFLHNLKPLPLLTATPDASEEVVETFRKINKCIECGFCEVNCVSCGLTMSSRTRIAALREITRLRTAGETKKADALAREYKYLGEETCAGDGLCSTSCPMGINVSELTHELRRLEYTGGGFWTFAAAHFPAVKNGLRLALGAASIGRKVLGDKAMASVCRGLHKAGVPLWTPAFPGPYRMKFDSIAANDNGPGGQKSDKPAETGSVRLTGRSEILRAVYFPSCFNQMMGAPEGYKPLVEETVSLLQKTGYEVIFPQDYDKLCCGTIWESKGMPEIAEKKVRELEEALWAASGQGRYPVLCDQSPCLHRMRKCINKMHLYEPAEFISKFLVQRLVFTQDNEPVAVHLTCSSRLMGVDKYLVELARRCSTNVLVPEEIGCCGFAGDKGMTHPELNAWALRKLRTQVEKAGVRVGYSNSRTCEIGLTTNSGIPYLSIVYLVNSHTEGPKKC